MSISVIILVVIHWSTKLSKESDAVVEEEFFWGTAASAFQVEGHPVADGAAESDWYRLTHIPEMIVDGSDADIACDHYTRWPEDIEIMREIGVNSYRLGVAWPRVFSAPGKINMAGMDFYDRLIDHLCAAEIMPFVTMFHWDIPYWLVEKGGWVCRDSSSYFAEYAGALMERLSDRVKYWITLNEPYVYYHSYITGWHWPFEVDEYGKLLAALHNLLTGHQLAVNICKERYAENKIGMVLSYHYLLPAHDTHEDRLAVTQADGVRNRWFLDRTMHGKYPQDILELYGKYLPDADFSELRGDAFNAPDFIGLNYYSPGIIQYDRSGSVYKFSSPVDDFELQPTVGNNPAGLYEMVARVERDYGPIDVFITENGYLEYAREYEQKDPTQDYRRIDYMQGHLSELRNCVNAGHPVRGYFYWSLLDNFEWRWGLSRKYGLVHVDKTNQDRTLKKSAYWYKNYIAAYRQEQARRKCSEKAESRRQSWLPDERID